MYFYPIIQNMPKLPEYSANSEQWLNQPISFIYNQVATELLIHYGNTFPFLSDSLSDQATLNLSMSRINAKATDSIRTLVNNPVLEAIVKNAYENLLAALKNLEGEWRVNEMKRRGNVRAKNYRHIAGEAITNNDLYASIDPHTKLSVPSRNLYELRVSVISLLIIIGMLEKLIDLNLLQQSFPSSIKTNDVQELCFTILERLVEEEIIIEIDGISIERSTPTPSSTTQRISLLTKAKNVADRLLDGHKYTRCSPPSSITS